MPFTRASSLSGCRAVSTACLKAGSVAPIAALLKTRTKDDPAPLWGSWSCIRATARPDSVFWPPLFFRVPPLRKATIEPASMTADTPSTAQRYRKTN